MPLLSPNGVAVNELDSILSTLKTQGDATREAVLTTVVHVQGSAYRRPGARMLILPDGRRIGTVSRSEEHTSELQSH